ncbi:hypothetical protein GGX14DRAFT_390316 [Mycena pura]|uniref:Uncharacterized protein n=1 Tax=Mycena pura TaxID=153505 RepID=A0AAD6YI12_9AGAR|nr:hypothetical protein GGX14DRAFT_390316 [Mycena pura]
MFRFIALLPILAVAAHTASTRREAHHPQSIGTNEVALCTNDMLSKYVACSGCEIKAGLTSQSEAQGLVDCSDNVLTTVLCAQRTLHLAKMPDIRLAQLPSTLMAQPQRREAPCRFNCVPSSVARVQQQNSRGVTKRMGLGLPQSHFDRPESHSPACQWDSGLTVDIKVGFGAKRLDGQFDGSAPYSAVPYDCIRHVRLRGAAQAVGSGQRSGGRRNRAGGLWKRGGGRRDRVGGLRRRRAGGSWRRQQAARRRQAAQAAGGVQAAVGTGSRNGRRRWRTARRQRAPRRWGATQVAGTGGRVPAAAAVADGGTGGQREVATSIPHLMTQRQTSAMRLEDDAVVIPLMPLVPLELRESHFFGQKWDSAIKNGTGRVPVPLFSYILKIRHGQ